MQSCELIWINIAEKVRLQKKRKGGKYEKN